MASFAELNKILKKTQNNLIKISALNKDKIDKQKSLQAVNNQCINEFSRLLIAHLLKRNQKFRKFITRGISEAKKKGLEAARSNFMSVRKKDGYVITGLGQRVLDAYDIKITSFDEAVDNFLKKGILGSELKFEVICGDKNELDKIQVKSSNGKSYPLWMILEYGMFSKYENLYAIRKPRPAGMKLFQDPDIMNRLQRRKRIPEYLPMYAGKMEGYKYGRYSYDYRKIKKATKKQADFIVKIFKMANINSMLKSSSTRNKQRIFERKKTYGIQGRHFIYYSRMRVINILLNFTYWYMRDIRLDYMPNGDYYSQVTMVYADVYNRDETPDKREFLKAVRKQIDMMM